MFRFRGWGVLRLGIDGVEFTLPYALFGLGLELRVQGLEFALAHVCVCVCVCARLFVCVCVCCPLGSRTLMPPPKAWKRLELNQNPKP